MKGGERRGNIGSFKCFIRKLFGIDMLFFNNVIISDVICWIFFGMYILFVGKVNIFVFFCVCYFFLILMDYGFLNLFSDVLLFEKFERLIELFLVLLIIV